MNFTPEGYQPPKKSGDYLKLEDGNNKIRILTRPVIGWKYEGIDEKWHYSKEEPKVEQGQIKDGKYGRQIKHFWKVYAYSYNESAIRVLEIAQFSIQSQIMNLAGNPDWGSPLEYDITIIREQENIVKYTVQPSPKKDLDEEIKKEFGEMEKIDFEKPFKETTIATAGTPEAKQEVADQVGGENIETVPWEQ